MELRELVFLVVDTVPNKPVVPDKVVPPVICPVIAPPLYNKYFDERFIEFSCKLEVVFIIPVALNAKSSR
jgi:hypothetical protein